MTPSSFPDLRIGRRHRRTGIKVGLNFADKVAVTVWLKLITTGFAMKILLFGVAIIAVAVVADRVIKVNKQKEAINNLVDNNKKTQALLKELHSKAYL